MILLVQTISKMPSPALPTAPSHLRRSFYKETRRRIKVFPTYRESKYVNETCSVCGTGRSRKWDAGWPPTLSLFSNAEITVIIAPHLPETVFPSFGSLDPPPIGDYHKHTLRLQAFFFIENFTQIRKFATSVISPFPGHLVSATIRGEIAWNLELIFL